MAVGLGGVVARARRLAQKRGQSLTTTHLLLALAQGDESIAALLEWHGATEMELLHAVASVHEEPDQAVGLALERADKMARAWHAHRVEPGHLLLAIAREPRSAGYQLLEGLGVRPVDLREAALSLVHTGVLPEAAMRPRTLAERTQALKVSSARRPNLRRPRPLQAEDQVALAAETESKRLRRGAASEEAAVQPAVEPESTLVGEAAPRPRRARKGGIARAAEGAATQPSEPRNLALDPERFPMLCGLGRNLTELAAQGHIDPIIGRDREIDQLLDILCRRRANNPLLVGPPGVGKTAVVEGLALRLATADGEPALSGSSVIEISAGALVSGTGVRGALSEKLAVLREEVRQADGRVILFLDEVHSVVGQGEGGDSLANELKTALSRGELPCIGATTEAEYRRVFERDAALARRFTRIEVEEPEPEAALEILRGIAPRYELHHTAAYAPDALAAAVQMSVRFVSDGQLPDKAIAIIDQAAARVRRRGGRVVDRAAVADVVAERSGVPVERLLMQDGELLLSLEEHLSERVVGQEAAVTAVAQAIRKSAVGFRGVRPLGSFLFLGATGVGKTEMAKGIAERLFPKSDLVRIDMSEFSEPHSVARLLGAPPGYVGHEEGGQLTEPVRRRGYCLVLLDEIEKAHPEVLLSLLPLLDEGHMTDGRGRRVDFSNTVVVMTSNLGADALKGRRAGGIGFGAAAGRASDEEAGAEAVLSAARAALPPELWNRIDEPLYFRPLARASVARIARRLLEGAAVAVARQHGIALEVGDSAVDALIDGGGFDAQLGARPMKRAVGRLVEAPLAEALLSGRIGPGMRVALRGDGTEIVIESVDAEAAE